MGLEVLEKGVFNKPCLGCGDELCPRWKGANPAPNPPGCEAALQIPWEASGMEFPASTFVFPPQMINVLLFPVQPQTLVVVRMHKSAPGFPFPGVVWDCCGCLSSPNATRGDGLGALLH